ncbi:hypothetical protein T08_14427 [Trichinella sp. T8]|nr:hypothetical protein T08_14427 [Trichinella sp. T8]
MASSIWYCTIAALRLSGTSAARKYLSMRMNHRSTSEDRRRQALDSSATFRIQRVYYRPRSTKDYTKSYDKKIEQTERGTLYR